MDDTSAITMQANDQRLFAPRISMDLIDVVKTLPGLELRPALIVGLGGTGVYSVRRAKQVILERVGQIPTLGFLCVDSDNKAFADAPGLATLQPAEAFNFGTRAVLPVANSPELHEWLYEQLPGLVSQDILNLARGAGCGQKRVRGRAGLLALFGSFEARFRAALMGVTGIASTLAAASAKDGVTVAGDPIVYVVASLAGGTGSSAFVDVALLARELAGAQSTVVGIFVLPDAFDDKLSKSEQDLVRANAYAALKELQCLQEASPAFSLTVKKSSTATMRLKAGEALFDLCYLIDAGNESRKRLSKSEDVFELIARLLLHENGTPLGSRASSTRANLETAKNASPCKKTKLHRQFSTFSNTVLRFPVERAARFCVWSKMKDVVVDTFAHGKKPCTEDVLKGKVDSFLDGNHLNDLGPTNNQVQERLLSDTRRSGAPLFASEKLDPDWGQNAARKKFVSDLRKKETALQTSSLPRAKTAIAANVQKVLLGSQKDGELLETLEKVIDNFFVECIQAYGAQGTHRVWQELRSRFSAMKSEMTSENHVWSDSDRKSQKSTMDNALLALEGMHQVQVWFGQSDEELKRKAVAAFNCIVEGDFRACARNEAIKVFDPALFALDSRAGLVERFLETAGRLTKQLRENVNSIRQGSATATGGFVLEMDVADVEDIEKYYDNQKVDANQVVESMLGAGLIGKAGDRSYFYQRLFGMGVDELYTVLGGYLCDMYLPSIMAIDAAKYADDKIMTPAIGARIAALFSMCEPFWVTQKPTSDTIYHEVRVLGCAFTSGPSGPVANPVVAAWAEKYGVGGDHPLQEEATTTSYEVQFVRYTHGARAFYLEDASKWKELYDRWSKGSGGFPLHIHRDFVSLPDLDSAEAARAADIVEARRAFALGTAMGFVAQYGQEVFFSLAKESAAIAGETEVRYKVDFLSDWHTLLGPANARKFPDTGGKFVFEPTRKKAPARLRLGTDRCAACQALQAADSAEKVKLISDAVREYVTAVSSTTAREQAGAYLQTVDAYLETAKIAPEVRKQIEVERTFVEEWRVSL